jgi:arylsulfatase A-like enzyme
VAGTSWLQATHGGYTFTQASADFSDLVFRRRLQTLQTVDDMIAAVVAALAAAGQLDNAYLVTRRTMGTTRARFGLVYDKRNPFETDTHLPLLIRGPGVTAGSATAAPVHMTDLSATFLDMAGVTPPPEFDSVSVLPLLAPAPPTPRLAAYT